MYMCGGISAGTRMTADDILYNTLPLYHSNGGLGLAGNAIRQGNHTHSLTRTATFHKFIPG